MPAFLELEFWKLDNPELWVAVGLALFVVILFLTGAIRTVLGMLDAKAATIKADLEEAARLRTEAEALLAEIKTQREEAEVQGVQMLKEAKADALGIAAEAKVKLEDSIARREVLAERRIANAKTQAMAEVKAAAADLAAQLAESVLTDRVKAMKSDPAVDQAIGQLAERLQ